VRSLLGGVLALWCAVAAAQANLALRPDASGIALNGDYRLYRDPAWAFSATGAFGGSLGQTRVIDLNWQSGIRAQYTRLLARRWSLSAGADYTKTRISEMQGIRLVFQGPVMRRLAANFSYAWSQDTVVKTETVSLNLSYSL
jgi:hypothetical protein